MSKEARENLIKEKSRMLYFKFFDEAVSDMSLIVDLNRVLDGEGMTLEKYCRETKAACDKIARIGYEDLPSDNAQSK